MQREPFNSDDPFDALAQVAKSETVAAAIRVRETPEALALRDSDDEEFGALLTGMLVGVCGVAMSFARMDDDIHARLRAVIIEIIPDAFDQARSIAGLPPLPRADQ